MLDDDPQILLDDLVRFRDTFEVVVSGERRALEVARHALDPETFGHCETDADYHFRLVDHVRAKRQERTFLRTSDYGNPHARMPEGLVQEALAAFGFDKITVKCDRWPRGVVEPEWLRPSMYRTVERWRAEENAEELRASIYYLSGIAAALQKSYNYDDESDAHLGDGPLKTLKAEESGVEEEASSAEPHDAIIARNGGHKKQGARSQSLIPAPTP
ncbi:hypothetical protein B0H17DRAFT_1214297 [Mycena rosella]|uniref:Uncharacterized protein n=1 Tax=Mycena rosella TaxID=1033263 RepID=A0AAD7CNE4_MYCRO|nr:hypothetical protein B0H17DRAFT_1214297 [Mycena rosella]